MEKLIKTSMDMGKNYDQYLALTPTLVVITDQDSMEEMLSHKVLSQGNKPKLYKTLQNKYYEWQNIIWCEARGSKGICAHNAYQVCSQYMLHIHNYRT